jgi:hypothetical protein
MITLNQAKAAYLRGEKDIAWSIAKLDSGLNESVTKDQWMAWAEKAFNKIAEVRFNRFYFQ